MGQDTRTYGDLQKWAGIAVAKSKALRCTCLPKAADLARNSMGLPEQEEIAAANFMMYTRLQLVQI